MSALKLEWGHYDEGDAGPEGWYVDGPICPSVERLADGYWWSVHDQSGVCDTLLAAQLAAEAAALTLLCEAVAAFKVECWATISSCKAGGLPGKGGGIHDAISVRDHRPKPFLLIDHADATRLACALLAAARGGGR